jgi:hypothetical protein
VEKDLRENHKTPIALAIPRGESITAGRAKM